LNAALKPSGDKVGFPLPEVGIELEAALAPQKRPKPAGEIHIIELHAGERPFFQGGFKSLTVLGGGEHPQPMCAAKALDQVPGHDIPTAEELRAGVCRAGKCTY
jgi:hypothetical protein